MAGKFEDYFIKATSTNESDLPALNDTTESQSL